MGLAAKKSSRQQEKQATTPASGLRNELIETAEKAAKGGNTDEAIYHFLGVFILDASMANHASGPSSEGGDTKKPLASWMCDEDLFETISKLAKKKYGTEMTKLWVAFADVHQEMQTLIAPITQPLDLGTSLKYFREAFPKKK